MKNKKSSDYLVINKHAIANDNKANAKRIGYIQKNNGNEIGVPPL